MTMRIGITGIGVLSALGDEPEAVHRSLCAGEHARRPLIDELLPDLGDAVTAPLPEFDAAHYLGADANLRPLDGTGRRMAAAVTLALRASGWTEADCAARPVGLVVGTMFAGMRTIAEFDRRAIEAGPQYVLPLDFANTVFNAAAGQAAIRYQLTGPNVTFGGGQVAALQALGYAADLLRSGQAAAVLAGGVDELSREALRAFARAGLLSGGKGADGCPVPFDHRRDGCALGEGAVFFMLEPIDQALQRGATVLAEILASASAWAPMQPMPSVEGESDRRLGDDLDEVAEALARTIAQTFSRAGEPLAKLDAWSASASGAIGLDRTEARGFVNAMGEGAREVAVTAVKGAFGETLGAAGALQVAALLGAMASGRLPGVAGFTPGGPDLGFELSPADREVDLQLGLATAVGLDGAVEALLLRRWEGERSATG